LDRAGCPARRIGRPPGRAEADGVSAAVHRPDLLARPLSILAVGLDSLDERIKSLVRRMEELLDRKGPVAVPIDDQTTQEPALRVEVGRNES